MADPMYDTILALADAQVGAWRLMAERLLLFWFNEGVDDIDHKPMLQAEYDALAKRHPRQAGVPSSDTPAAVLDETPGLRRPFQTNAGVIINYGDEGAEADAWRRLEIERLRAEVVALKRDVGELLEDIEWHIDYEAEREAEVVALKAALGPVTDLLEARDLLSSHSKEIAAARRALLGGQQ